MSFDCKKLILCASVVMLLCASAFAQKGSGQNQTIVFDIDSWNFGEIEEVGGTVSHTFTYVNGGTKPVVLEIVRATCGCTTVDYSRKPLVPGQVGEMTVYFDPTNLPGQFHKTVSIVTNGGKNEYVLKIDGFVKPREKEVDELYPYHLPDGLQLSSQSINFGYVHHDTPLSKSIRVINSSKADIKLAMTQSSKSGYVKVSYPQTVKAGSEAEIKFTYDVTSKSGKYGSLNDVFGLSVNGTPTRQPIKVSGMAVDNFSDDRTDAPAFRYEPTLVDFGRVRQSGKAQAKVKLLNEGRSQLTIREVECRGGVSVDVAKGAVIKAGGSLTVTMRYVPVKGSRGTVGGGVSFFTNDPARPMREVRFSASVN